MSDNVDSSSISNVLAFVAASRKQNGAELLDHQARKKQKLDLPAPAPAPAPSDSLPPRSLPPNANANDNANATIIGFTKPVSNYNFKETPRNIPQRPQLAPRPSPAINKIVEKKLEISEFQRGNSELIQHLSGYTYVKTLKDVDFVVNSNIAILFLSINYFKVYKDKFMLRISKARKSPGINRVILVLVDVLDYHKYILDLNTVCLNNDFTMLCAWSNRECADYINYFRSVSNSTMIKGRRVKDVEVLANDDLFKQRVSDFLTSAPRIDKGNAAALMAKCKTVKDILSLSKEELLELDRMGEKKASSLWSAFNEPFFGSL